MEDPLACELSHVQQAYEQIGDHFSVTRYKPWPVVDRFLQKWVQSGWLGVDVGCGNGKNMAIRPDALVLGLDLSRALLSICQERSLETVCASMISLPWRPHLFDFGLCIAALHHLATAARRQTALREILRALRTDAPLLLFVWAWERDRNASVYRHPDQLRWLNEQDVLVPWCKPDGLIVDRFYHLFKEGELEALVIEAGGVILETGYDRDNWYVIAKRA